MGRTIPHVDSQEELHRNWLVWVTTNLGRDTRLAEIAARAATNAAELGQGFNKAEEAARTAWADAAEPSSNRGMVPPPKGHLARNLALGGLGCLLVIAAIAGAVLWFAASMYGCYAVMC